MFLRIVFQPILAANFTEVAIGLVVLLFTVIKALLEANKQANPKRGPAAPPTSPEVQPTTPKAPVAAGHQADQLRSQVEEFLRRAGKVPPQPAQAQQPQQRPVSEIELLVGGEAGPAPERPETDARRVSVSRLPERPRGSKGIKRRPTVAEHVAEAMASRSRPLAQETAKLGQRIVAEDLEFDEKLKAKFEHTLGTLAGRGGVETAAPPISAPPSLAAQIAALLANPEGVRQAVILNEILRRPSERW